MAPYGEFFKYCVLKNSGFLRLLKSMKTSVALCVKCSTIITHSSNGMFLLHFSKVVLVVTVCQSKKTASFVTRNIHKLGLQLESKQVNWPEPNSTKFHKSTEIRCKHGKFCSKSQILQAIKLCFLILSNCS